MTPDKIYLHKIRDEEKSGYYRDWFEERARCVPSVEYIRKEALLEWLKQNKQEMEQELKGSDGLIKAMIATAISSFQVVIEKLESL